MFKSPLWFIFSRISLCLETDVLVLHSLNLIDAPHFQPVKYNPHIPSLTSLRGNKIMLPLILNCCV
jgi:hypothetical protein